ncbi:hypothetical protein KEM54_004750, partial [Ascosphaera aggregata]
NRKIDAISEFGPSAAADLSAANAVTTGTAARAEDSEQPHSANAPLAENHHHHDNNDNNNNHSQQQQQQQQGNDEKTTAAPETSLQGELSVPVSPKTSSSTRNADTAAVKNTVEVQAVLEIPAPVNPSEP